MHSFSENTLQETLTPEQANEAIEDAIKNRVIAYCYKVPKEEEIQYLYEYVTLNRRLFQLKIEISSYCFTNQSSGSPNNCYDDGSDEKQNQVVETAQFRFNERKQNP